MGVMYQIVEVAAPKWPEGYSHELADLYYAYVIFFLPQNLLSGDLFDLSLSICLFLVCNFKSCSVSRHLENWQLMNFRKVN